MKAILICLSAIFSMSAVAAKELTAYEKTIRPVTDPDHCEFLKTAYFEVSHPSKVHYYAVQNVIDAGGDSYKIETIGGDVAVGMPIHTTTIAIYRCKEPQDRSVEMEAWKVVVQQKVMAIWRKPEAPTWKSTCEIRGKFNGHGELANLSWVTPCDARSVSKSIVRAFKKAGPFPEPPDPLTASAGVVFTFSP
ncbi:hypothetical protein C7S18_23755 (plasmid) [Ahniella affigens]|uniref:TonB C-terminal domain-containing protein n=1 Tax=Ahniella affigens TaxID=2021234 RepID=A0A2P1PZQ3_9GAMM|nr:TonB C-terminal domain-containing protein [Ahniella affigens]AVQ00316.1 hypothetical protein C7S18_23755 [Ahniella affigens]